MDIKNIADLINYPIDKPDSAEYKEIVNSVKAGLMGDGCSVLPNFLSSDGIDALVTEAEQRKSRAYYSPEKLCNVYLADGNPDKPSDHPQNVFMERTNGFITADMFGKDTFAYTLYYWEPLREFLAACLDKDELYIYADPVSNMIVNLCKPGQTFNWHFDTNDFTVTFLLKGAKSGGHFEYAPGLRTKDSECFEDVKKVLNGDRTRVKRLKLNSGDLQFFLGRFSLHQVTHNTGTTDRMLLIQSFTEVPGVVGSSERIKNLYGRTNSDYPEMVNNKTRSDTLLD
jgi:hypothetical protein